MDMNWKNPILPVKFKDENQIQITNFKSKICVFIYPITTLLKLHLILNSTYWKQIMVKKMYAW